MKYYFICRLEQKSTYLVQLRTFETFFVNIPKTVRTGITLIFDLGMVLRILAVILGLVKTYKTTVSWHCLDGRIQGLIQCPRHLIVILIAQQFKSYSTSTVQILDKNIHPFPPTLSASPAMCFNNNAHAFLLSAKWTRRENLPQSTHVLVEGVEGYKFPPGVRCRKIITRDRIGLEII